MKIVIPKYLLERDNARNAIITVSATSGITFTFILLKLGKKNHLKKSLVFAWLLERKQDKSLWASWEEVDTYGKKRRLGGRERMSWFQP